MALDTSDKLQEISTTIDESSAPYYTDVYSTGQTKEQLQAGLNVKSQAENRAVKRSSFIAITQPETIYFPFACKAVRIQANYSSGGHVGLTDITVNTNDGSWTGIFWERQTGTVYCYHRNGDIPSQVSTGYDFIRCSDTGSGV
jgi:hypothetical protein